MKVYRCTGFPFDELDGGAAYYRTKAEALKAAREATAPGPDSQGSTATVAECVIAAPINADRIVALLNRDGWAASQTGIATVRNGRVVSND